MPWTTPRGTVAFWMKPVDWDNFTRDNRFDQISPTSFGLFQLDCRTVNGSHEAVFHKVFPLLQFTANMQAYYAMIENLDGNLARLLAGLGEHGLADDTIVVWASDNAAGTLLSEPMGSSGYWRGTFGGGWEGSIRTPAMVRWPGHIPAGQRYRQNLGLDGGAVSEPGVLEPG